MSSVQNSHTTDFGFTWINLGSGTYTTFNYYGLDAGAPSGYYGRLWQIKTTKTPTTLQDMQYTWDANSNLTSRYNAVAGETENFGYDFLDRLTSVSGAYSNSFAYNQIGNITSMNGVSYTYGAKPHAVTAVGSTSYAYDANGNMTTRGDKTLTWDVENRMINAANPSEVLNKTFGGAGFDYAKAVQQTSDGGYIFAGYTNSSGAGGYDAWLIKTDSSLNQQWSRTFGTSGNEYAYDGQQTSDGGYILAGSNSSGAWLIKTDSSGYQQWSQTFGGAGSHARAVQQTSDGGYILAGSNGSQVRLIKTNSSGVQQWSQTYGSGLAYAVQQTTDGGYILTGTTLGQGLLIKTNSSGAQQWSQTFGGSGNDYFFDVRQTSDGGYIIAGSYSIPEWDEEYYEWYDVYYVWLLKTNSSGTQQWSQTYGGGDAFAIQQTTDGGYILAGRGSGARLIKTDSSGVQQWSRTFGAAYAWDYFYAVQQTSDGGYILAGITSSQGAGGTDAWLVKTDSQGVVVSQGPTSSFVYDGNGNRVQDTENGQTTLYINRYYEKNITTGEVTSHYYLGDREVAFRKGTTLEYLHQDHLGSTSVITNSSGTVVDTVKYYPFGSTRSSTAPLDTDKLFTGQRLDQTGLYFYNARYYDATIGRFISADTVGVTLTNPQTLNRYTYVLNNPLKFTDPSGHETEEEWWVAFWAVVTSGNDSANSSYDSADNDAASSILDEWHYETSEGFGSWGIEGGFTYEAEGMIPAEAFYYEASIGINTSASVGLINIQGDSWHLSGPAFSLHLPITTKKVGFPLGGELAEVGIEAGPVGGDFRLGFRYGVGIDNWKAEADLTVISVNVDLKKLNPWKWFD